jgi:hypothetical protein
MAHDSKSRRSIGRIRFLIEDLKDYFEYKHAYVNMDSPEAAELGRQYHDHKVKVRDAGRRAV